MVLLAICIIEGSIRRCIIRCVHICSYEPWSTQLTRELAYICLSGQLCGPRLITTYVHEKN